MMDFQRPILIAAIAAVSFMLLLEWNKFQQAKQSLAANAEQVVTEKPAIASTGGDAPALPVAINGDASVSEAPPAAILPSNTTSVIDVYSDTMHVKIDTTGGDIVMASLRKYPAKINQPDQPFIMLTRTKDQLYVAQSGLIGDHGTDKNNERPQYSAAQPRFEMREGDQQLQVDLQLLNKDGAKITKRYTFTRDTYLIDVSYIVDNNTTQPWSAVFYGQIKRDTHEPVSSGGVGMMPFLGGATSTKENNYFKMTFDDMAKTPLSETIQGGWIAMVQHYFISAWVPSATDSNRFYTTHQPSTETYLLGFTGPRVDIAAGQQGVLGAKFYVGPKDVYRLEEIAPFLDLTVDYGALWWIAKPLFSLTHWIHSLVGNWGLAIIGLTLCVKAIFLWPSNLSYKSMAVMKKLAPKMQEMKDAYTDNPTKLREEMFKLYQKEGANPMLGCLPMLIQTPVFIALYWSLMESVDLRQAPFYGWIVDLSAQDPYFVLPLLMGVSMWIQQKLNPPPADPMQQRIFQLMPIIFTGMFLFFPSGLVLYMLVNNIISMAHQFWINRTMLQPAAK